MAGDDLLHQGGAGARQADDQQRRLVVPAESRIGGKEVAGKSPHQPIDIGRECRLVEFGAPASDPVGQIEMLHCRRVIAQIVEQLADGEMKQEPALVVDPVVGEERKHPRQPWTVGVAAPSRIDRGEMSRNLQRVQLEDAVERVACFGKTPLADEDITEQLRQRGAVRMVGQGPPQPDFCSRKVLRQQQCLGKVPLAPFGVWSAGPGVAKALRCFLVVAGKFEQLAQRGMHFGQIRSQLDGPAIGRLRLAIQALPVQRQAQITIGLGIVAQRGGKSQAGRGFGEAVERQQGPAERVMRGGFARIELGRPAKGSDRGGEPARLDQPDAALALPPGGGASVGIGRNRGAAI